MQFEAEESRGKKEKEVQVIVSKYSILEYASVVISAPVGTADHTVLIEHFTFCVGIETTQHLIGSGHISYIESLHSFGPSLSQTLIARHEV